MGGLLTASGVWAMGKYKEAPIALLLGVILLVLNPLFYLKLRSQEKKDK